MAVPRVKLFDGRLTLLQGIVVGLWGAGLAGIFIIWCTTALPPQGSDVSDFLFSLGRLLGLLAVFFALVQFMLMGRVFWVERSFGLDRLAGYHRLNGYATIICILAHSTTIVMAYSLSVHTNFITQYIDIVRQFPYAWMALVAESLFVIVVVSSIYIVRRRLQFESWYLVHLIVYAAITLAFFHQFALGGSFNQHPLARTYWYVLYAFVGLNVLFWRFTFPTLTMLRFGFKVNRVVAETATSTSVYLTGKGLQHWKAKPGQFVLVRILSRELWLQEHPFSLSMTPVNDEFRLTIRNVGSYTEAISRLKPGSWVLVSGPFGRFTSDIARTDKRLFIAGGVGITPICTLATEAVAEGRDSQLLYASRSKDDVILQSDIDNLQDKGLRTSYLYGAAGHLDGSRIEALASDFRERDVYLCGPPPMMEALIESLLALGLPVHQLHYERFSLHN